MHKFYQRGPGRHLQEVTGLARLHHHPAEASLRDMSIDDILAEARKHASEHETNYEEAKVS